MAYVKDGWADKWFERLAGSGRPYDLRKRIPDQFNENGWWFLVAQCRVGRRFIAMAKEQRFETGNPLTEPGDLWFEFDDTADMALVKLQREIFGLQS